MRHVKYICLGFLEMAKYMLPPAVFIVFVTGMLYIVAICGHPLLGIAIFILSLFGPRAYLIGQGIESKNCKSIEE